MDPHAEQSKLVNRAPIQVAKKAAPTQDEVPTFILNGFGEVVARHMTIASVHFEQRQERFWHSNRRIFTLEAAPKGGVSYLKIYDSQQYIPHFEAFDQEATRIPAPVRVESIMDNLEASWGMIQTSRQLNLPIGIRRIAGDEITEQEKKELMRLETRMCQAAVAEADRFYAKGEGDIMPFHRACLEWLGSERRPWFKEIQYGETKTGPMTGQLIPMNALGDGGHNLLDFYITSGMDPLTNGDTYIANLLKTDPKLRARLKRAQEQPQ